MQLYKLFKLITTHHLSTATKVIMIFIIVQTEFKIAFAETIEVKISHPIFITSLRNFTKTSDDIELYVSQPRNGSAFIKTDEGYGIMAVVQIMNLQNIHSDYKTLCLDYLQISELNGTGSTGNICGSSETNSYYQSPTFVDKTGEIELTYVLQEKYRVTPFEGSYTNFNITFTPFTECPEDAFPFGNNYLRPCSAVDSFSCIPVEFFCDGIVNCAFPGEYALDEIYCSKSTKFSKKSQNPPLPPKEEKVELMKEVEHNPYDPYIPAGIPHLPKDEQKTTTDRNLLISNMNSNNSLSLGLLGVLILLVSLFSLGRMHRVTREPFHREIIQNVDKVDSSSRTNLIINQEYDIESDPTPSYEDCLLNSDSIFITELYIECEHPPPSYEEVKVHQTYLASDKI